MKNADELFERGTFAAPNGINLNYRIYYPENFGKDGKVYPMLLSMHGNGSRGEDNSLQLTGIGAALTREIFNSDYPCVILAPQCIRASEWVSTYVGDENYDRNAPQNPYLVAAWALFEIIRADRHIDRSRIYICGSSNGAGAAWDLILRHPNVFAAAVPIAGTGRLGRQNPQAVAKDLTKTPITTFHGDADAMLHVEGTRELAAAIKECGGNIRYYEVPGATHGNIWGIAAHTEGLIDWMFAQRKETNE